MISAKRKREEDQDRTEKTNNNINRYFTNKPSNAAPKPKPIVSTEDNSFIAGLLGEVDANVPSRTALPTIKTESRRKTRVLSPPRNRENQRPVSQVKPDEPANAMLNTPPLEPGYNGMSFPDDDIDETPLPVIDHLPSSPAARAADRKAPQASVKFEEDDDDDIMEVAQPVGIGSSNNASVNISGARPAQEIKKPEPYLSPPSSSPTRPAPSEIDASAWNDVTSKLNVVSNVETASASIGKLSIENAVESDRCLNFFWTDYTEANGSLCLFGKVKDRLNGNFVSAFVKVDNILRKLFFLPRTHRQSKFNPSSNDPLTDDMKRTDMTLVTKSNSATCTTKQPKSCHA